MGFILKGGTRGCVSVVVIIKMGFNASHLFLNILGILLQDGMILQIVIGLNFGMMEILNQFLSQKTSNHIKFLKTVHGGTLNFIKYSTIGFQIQNLYFS